MRPGRKIADSPDPTRDWRHHTDPKRESDREEYSTQSKVHDKHTYIDKWKGNIAGIYGTCKTKDIHSNHHTNSTKQDRHIKVIDARKTNEKGNHQGRDDS